MAITSFLKTTVLLLLPIATVSSVAHVRKNNKIRNLQNQPIFGDTATVDTTNGQANGGLFQPQPEGTVVAQPVPPTVGSVGSTEPLLTEGDRVLVVDLLPFTITFAPSATARQPDLGLSNFFVLGFSDPFPSVESADVTMTPSGTQGSFTGTSTFRSPAVVTDTNVNEEDVYDRQREILTVEILNQYWAANPQIGNLQATSVTVEPSAEESERYLPPVEPWIIGVTVVVVVIVLAFIILTMPRA